eukprot:tig00000581_g2219.t1
MRAAAEREAPRAPLPAIALGVGLARMSPAVEGPPPQSAPQQQPSAKPERRLPARWRRLPRLGDHAAVAAACVLVFVAALAPAALAQWGCSGRDCYWRTLCGVATGGTATGSCASVTFANNLVAVSYNPTSKLVYVADGYQSIKVLTGVGTMTPATITVTAMTLGPGVSFTKIEGLDHYNTWLTVLDTGFGNGGKGGVLRVQYSDGTITYKPPAANAIQNIKPGVAVDSTTGDAYFGDITGRIYKAGLNNNNPSIVSQGDLSNGGTLGNSILAHAVHQTLRRLYTFENANKNAYYLNLTAAALISYTGVFGATDVATLTADNSGAGLAVHQTTGHLYLTTFNAGTLTAKLYYINMTAPTPALALMLTSPTTGVTPVDGSPFSTPVATMTQPTGFAPFTAYHLLAIENKFVRALVTIRPPVPPVLTTSGAPSPTSTAGSVLISAGTDPNTEWNVSPSSWTLFINTTIPSANVTVTASTTSYTFTDLNSGTVYEVYASAANLAYTSSTTFSAAVTFKTLPAPPAAPTVSVSSKNWETINLLIIPPSNTGGSTINGTRIYRNGTLITTLGEGIWAYMDSGRTRLTTYSYTAVCSNDMGWGTMSSALAVQTTAAPPGPPTLSAGTVTATSIFLVIAYPADNGGAAINSTMINRNGTLVSTLSSGVFNWTDSTVTRATLYAFTAKVSNAISESNASSVLYVTTPPTPPATPSVSGAALNATAVSLTITAPADDGGAAINGTRIFRNGTLIATLAGAASSYVDAALTRATTYSYTVTMTNAIGESPLSAAAVVTTPPTPPGKPSLGSGMVTATTVALTVTYPADDGGRAINGTLIFRNSSLVATLAAGVLTWTDSNATRFTVYSYTCVVTNSEGWSVPSAALLVTTPQTPPGTPSVAGAALNATAASLTITAPADDGGAAINGTRIFRNGTLIATLAGAASSYVDAALTRATTYSYTVTMTNAIGESPLSAAAVVTTPPTPPGKPSLGSGTVTATTVALNVTYPADDGGRAINGTLIFRNSSLVATLAAGVLTWTDSNATRFTVYSYTCVVTNSEGWSVPSAALLVTTPQTPPGTPSVAGAALNATAASLTITAPADDGGAAINGTRIFRNGTLIAMLAGAASSYVDAALTRATTYSYTVTMTNAIGESPLSAAAVVTTPPTPPGKPSLGSGTVTATTVALNVTYPADDGGRAINGTLIFRNSSLVATLAAGVLTWTDSNATRFTVYSYTCVVTNSEGWSVPSAALLVTTPQTPPGTPSVAGAALNATAALLTITAPADDGGAAINGTRIFRNGTLIATLAGAASSYVDAALTRATTYSYTVTMTNAIGESPLSAAAVVTTPPTPPGKPSLGSGTVTATTVALNVTYPADDGGRAINGTLIFRNSSLVATLAAGVLTWTDSNATRFTVYSYTCVVTNSEGWSVPSAALLVMTLQTPPGTPSVAGAVLNATAASLTITAPADDGGAAINGTRIFRNGTLIATLAGAASSYVDAALTRATTYSYTVTMTNAIGESPLSAAAVVTTPPTPPGKPSLGSGTVTATTVALNVTYPADDGGRAINGTLIFRNSSLVATLAAGVLTWTDSNATRFTVYSYTCVVTNSEGWSVASAALLVTTPQTPPGTPSVAGAALNATAVSLTITAPADDGGAAINGTRIFRNGTLIATLAGAASSYVDAALTRATTYSYTVTMTNAIGESPLSAAAVVTTPPTPPGKSSLGSGTVTATTVALNVTYPADDGGRAINGTLIFRNSSLVATLAAGVLTWTDSNATRFTVYSYTCVVTNSEGWSVPSAALLVTTLQTPPGTPSVAGAALNATAASLTITAPADDGGAAINGTRIFRNGTLIATLAGAASSYVDAALTRATTYSYTVTMTNAIGESPLSAAAVVTTPPTPPGKPSLGSGMVTATTVALNVTYPADDGGRAINGTLIFRNSSLVATLAAGVLTWTDSNATRFTVYSYTCVVTNSEGWSVPSAALLVTTPQTPPGTPSVAGAALNATAVSLTITAPADDGGAAINGTRIFRNGTLIATLAGAASSYVDAALTRATTYSYTVTMTNAIGESPLSAAAVVTTPPTPPGKPSLGSGTVTATTVALNVTYPADDGGRAINGTLIFRNSSLVATLAAGVLTWTDSNATRFTVYSYTCVVTNSEGWSVPSAAVVVTTPQTPPGTPSVAGAALNATAVSLTITAPSDDGGTAINGTRIFRNGTLIATLAGAASSYVDAALTRATTYSYTVTMTNAIGESPLSAAAAVTTPPTPPGKPSLGSGMVTATTVALNVTYPADDGGRAINGTLIFRNSSLVATLAAGVLTWTDSNATRFTVYSYTCVVTNSKGWSVPSVAVVVTTPQTPPVTPSVAGAALNATAASLTITAPADDGGAAINGTRIFRNGTLIATLAGAASSYVDAALTRATTYSYTVTMTNAIGESPLSAAAVVTTPPTPPGKPSLGSGMVTATTVALNVTYPADDGGRAINGTLIFRNSSLVATLTAGVLTWTDSNATRFTVYSYTCVVTNSEGWSVPSAALLVTTLQTPPGTPSVAGAALNATAASLTITAPADDGGAAINGTRIFRNGTLIATLAGAASSYVDAALTRATTYSYVVSVTNAIGESQNSVLRIVATPATPPGAPNMTSVVIDARWAVIAISQHSDDGGATVTALRIYKNGTLAMTLNPGATSFTATGLRRKTYYSFIATAVNSAGASLHSAAVTFTTLVNAEPEAPAVAATTVNSSALALAISFPGDDGGAALNSTYIYRNGTLIALLSNFTANFTDVGLTRATLYSYTVGTSNVFGVSPLSEVAYATTLPTPPGAPALSFASSTPTSATLSITRPVDDGGRNIVVTQVFRNGTLVATLAGTPSLWTDTALRRATTYSFTCVMINSVGPSTASAPLLVTTPPTPPSAPFVSGAPLNATAASLAVSAPADDGGAAINRTLLFRNGTLVATISGSAGNWTDTSLYRATYYAYWAAAVNHIGQGDNSTAVVFETPPTVPHPPSLSLTAIRARAVTLRITYPADDGGRPITATYVYRNGTLVKTLAAGVLAWTDWGVNRTSDYVYTAQVETVVGRSEASDALLVWTPYDIPSPPTLTGTILSATSASLSFVTGDDGGLPLNGTKLFRNGTLIAVLGPAVRTYLDANLTRATGYAWRVLAFNPVGDGNSSEPLELATPPTRPGAPRLRATSVRSSSVVINATHPEDDGGTPVVALFVLRDGVQVAELRDGAKGFLDPAFRATTYTYTAYALNAVGEGPLSDPLVVTTPKTPPSAPALSAVALNWSAVALTIGPPEDDGGAALAELRIVRNAAPLATLPPSTAEYTDTAFEFTETFVFTYVAVFSNEVGTGEPSKPVTIRPPLKPLVFDMPQDLPGSAVGLAAGLAGTGTSSLVAAATMLQAIASGVAGATGAGIAGGGAGMAGTAGATGWLTLGHVQWVALTSKMHERLIPVSYGNFARSMTWSLVESESFPLSGGASVNATGGQAPPSVEFRRRRALGFPAVKSGEEAFISWGNNVVLSIGIVLLAAAVRALMALLTRRWSASRRVPPIFRFPQLELVAYTAVYCGMASSSLEALQSGSVGQRATVAVFAVLALVGYVSIVGYVLWRRIARDSDLVYEDPRERDPLGAMSPQLIIRAGGLRVHPEPLGGTEKGPRTIQVAPATVNLETVRERLADLEKKPPRLRRSWRGGRPPPVLEVQPPPEDKDKERRSLPRSKSVRRYAQEAVMSDPEGYRREGEDDDHLHLASRSSVSGGSSPGRSPRGFAMSPAAFMRPGRPGEPGEGTRSPPSLPLDAASLTASPAAPAAPSSEPQSVVVSGPPSRAGTAARRSRWRGAAWALVLQPRDFFHPKSCLLCVF